MLEDHMLENHMLEKKTNDMHMTSEPGTRAGDSGPTARHTGLPDQGFEPY